MEHIFQCCQRIKIDISEKNFNRWSIDSSMMGTISQYYLKITQLSVKGFR